MLAQAESMRDDTENPFHGCRFDHVGVRVPDFAAAVAWYGEMPGFSLLHSMALGERTLAFLGPAGQGRAVIELVAGPGCALRPQPADLADSHALGGWHHLSLRVADVDAALALLARKGVTVVSGARDVPPLGLRFAFFADPWNNLFELNGPIGA
jgi:catechol 2,3-dioxygenase-like lactoylglutathione lyase family enzyme